MTPAALLAVAALSVVVWALWDRSRGGLFWYSGDDISRAALDLIWPYKHDSREDLRERFRATYPPRMRRAVMSWADFYEDRRRWAPREEIERRERLNRYDAEDRARKERLAKILEQVRP